MTEQEKIERDAFITLVTGIPASQKQPAKTNLVEENERLKAELAEVKRFLQELYHSGNKVVPEIWRVRMQRFVK